MLRFFGKPNDEETRSSEARLRSVEWKVNLILALIAIELALTMLILVRQYLIPSTTTLILCGLVLAAAVWFFRNQIPGLVKRLLFRQFVDGDAASRGGKSETDDSIR